MYYVRSPHSALAGGFGSPDFTGEVGPSQSALNALSAVAFEDALVSRVGSSLAPGTTVPGGERGSVLVDGAGPSSQGGSIRDTGSGSTPVLRRVSVGVGRTPPRSCSVRGVVGAGEVATHPSSQNEGIVSGIAVISRFGRRSSFDSDVRQLDGCGLRQQAGRYGVPLPLLVGQSPSEVDGESLSLRGESSFISLNGHFLPWHFIPATSLKAWYNLSVFFSFDYFSGEILSFLILVPVSFLCYP